MDTVGNVLAERREDRIAWGPAALLAFLLHAAVFGALLVSVFAKPMRYAAPRAVAVRLIRMGSPTAPEARTAPAPAPPAAAEKPKIEKPPEEKLEPPSEKALLLPAKEDKKKPTPAPVSRPGRAATDAIGLPTAGEESHGTATGPTAGAGGTAGIGGLKVDQADFEYPYYIEQMLRIISINWFRPTLTVQVKPVVHFQIQRDGALTNVRIVTPSGLAFVDRAALRAVEASSPLPPLPPGYPGTHLGVQLAFE